MTPRIAALLLLAAASPAHGSHYGSYDGWPYNSQNTYFPYDYSGSDQVWSGSYRAYDGTAETGLGGYDLPQDPDTTEPVDYGFGREEGGCSVAAPWVGWSGVLLAVLISAWSRGRHPSAPQRG